MGLPPPGAFWLGGASTCNYLSFDRVVAWPRCAECKFESGVFRGAQPASENSEPAFTVRQKALALIGKDFACLLAVAGMVGCKFYAL